MEIFVLAYPAEGRRLAQYVMLVLNSIFSIVYPSIKRILGEIRKANIIPGGGDDLLLFKLKIGLTGTISKYGPDRRVYRNITR